MRAQKRKCLTYWGGDRKKCNVRRKGCQKRSITLKNAWLPLDFMLWNGSGKPIQHVISFWLWAKGISTVFKLNQRKAVRNAKSAFAMILSLKTYQKCFLCYHLSCSLKIFQNVFAFLYVRVNCKEICEEISFPSFFQKNADVSILLRFKANYLEKMRGYPYFSLWIPLALAKIFFFCVVLTWRKNLCI